MRFLLKILLLNSFVFLAQQLTAQELNCKVEVVSQKITGVDNAVFQRLQRNLSDILNTTAWTNKKVDEKEKISCTFVLTLDAKKDANTYQASMQVQADRPVFNSTYATPLLNHRDKQVLFTFLPGESLQYTIGSRNNNLVAVAAFYAYLIISIDADSFAKFGGSKTLKEAQNIVYQQGNEGGWSASSNKINRYRIIEDLLNYKDLRETIYTYHREGLDKMVSEPRQAIENLLSSIENLQKVYKQSSDAAAIHLFFDAKAGEITQSATAFSTKERQKLYALLVKIAPGHLGTYKALE